MLQAKHQLIEQVVSVHGLSSVLSSDYQTIARCGTYCCSNCDYQVVQVVVAE